MQLNLFSAGFAAHAGATAHAVEPQWKPLWKPTGKPTRPVALAFTHAPGGRSGRVLRLMVKVFQAQK